MRSSTSSSSEREPQGRWKLTWVMAVILLVFALTGWKVYWTVQGFGVSLPNDLAAWASTRATLRNDSTILIGTSRIQGGMVPEVWADVTGGRPPLQLAILGTTPLPVLEHLATQTDFHGLLIVGIVEMYLFDAEEGNRRGAAAIAEYRSLMTSPARRTGLALDRLLPQQLLVRHTKLSFSGILEALWQRHAPVNPAPNMKKDRWMEFEGDRLKPGDSNYTQWESKGRPANAAEREAVLAEIETFIAQIRSRGGSVVLVAFPACGERREIEQRRYPRDLYWEPLAAATSALAINTYDIPELADFECTDGSHLDEADAHRFTRALAAQITADNR
jgi:hypothetical protein